MGLLNREAILGADDLKSEVVPVPEWGGDVMVRTMTGTQRDAFTRSLVGEDGKPNTENFVANLVAASVVGEDGEPLFTAADVAALAAKSAQALDRVAVAAQRLSKIGADAVEAAEGN